MYLEALDEQGPVAGLTPNDVSIFDSGANRTITQLVRADDPMRILLLVDNGRSAQPFIQEIRAGIVAFADAIPTMHELGLVTIGNTPVVRQEPSLDRTKLKHIAKTLTTGGTTVLVNAVYEMYDRFLRTAGDRWPVLVIVTSDGSEPRAVLPEKSPRSAETCSEGCGRARDCLDLCQRRCLQVQIGRALTEGTGALQHDALARPDHPARAMRRTSSPTTTARRRNIASSMRPNRDRRRPT